MRRVKSASRRSITSPTRSRRHARLPLALLESLESRWLLNDAPAMYGAEPMGAIDEDAINNGTLVATLIGANGADADPGDVLGIAVTGVVNANGQWQYSIDNGMTWNELGAPSTTESRLLGPDDVVRFVPNADWSGTVTDGLSFRGWDQSAGTAGTLVDVSVNGDITPYSAEEVYSSIVVNAVNDIPSFTKGGDVSIAEDAGAQSTDGWATALSAGPADEAGQTLSFEVSTNNDALFSAVPAIDSTGKLTFTPAVDASGTATVTVRLKDNGGIAAGGVDTSADQTFTITVTPVNDAPVLAGTQNLTAINEDATTNTGTLVSDLILGQTIDADSGALKGIAITAVDTTHGTWEYTTDGGTTWTAIAGVANTTALLLAADANTRVRFVPTANWNGTVTAGLTFRAWDQTTGTAGATADTTTNGTTTAFSTATAQANIAVNAVNDVPSFTKGGDVSIA
ncbi:MAG: hypothetical protein ACM359_16890, partial [Bacillota bacterium]